MATPEAWIASSQELLAMTGRGRRKPHPVIASEAKQSRGHKESLDCFVARAPRNDGERTAETSPRHCERSEAIQGPQESLDCFVARAPRNDGERTAETSPHHCERSEAIQ